MDFLRKLCYNAEQVEMMIKRHHEFQRSRAQEEMDAAEALGLGGPRVQKRK